MESSLKHRSVQFNLRIGILLLMILYNFLFTPDYCFSIPLYDLSFKALLVGISVSRVLFISILQPIEEFCSSMNMDFSPLWTC